MKLISKAKTLKSILGKIYRQNKELQKLKSKVLIDPNSKPKVLNLNIVDHCNSKCTMCNIWKQDEVLEITPKDLSTILKDPLYSELKHVGVTGGEPTLRGDLVDIYKAIIETIPEIKGLSIITNAIKEEEVKSTIKEIKLLCDSYNKNFSVMVSIDGVGKAHDQVRGVKGNFETAINVFNYVKTELKIPVTFGCTISKVNVWDCEDLLYYAKKNDMKGRFRVAETINRLYNHNRGKVIRNFNDDETYALMLFFEKLKRTYEKNNTYKRTYSSIQNILSGGDRLIGCPYHNDGIVLGSQGQLSYCAPKSKDIGNALKKESNKIYSENFDEKVRILSEDCNNCIHDYHAPITYRERKAEIIEDWQFKLLKIDKVNTALKVARILKKTPKTGKFRIFVIGWYGTETVGDKAILGGIIDFYREKFEDNLEIIIGSLYPFVTDRTCKELSINAKIVSTKTIDLLRYSKSSDEIIMGGGPLMDLEELFVPYLGFKVAKDYGNKTTIFGCGIGPLKKSKYLNTVNEILSITDCIKLRDKNSIEYYNSLGFKKKAEFFGDPAKEFVKKRAEVISNSEKENILSCYLRDWTFEYFDGKKVDFDEYKDKFERGLAHYIGKTANNLNIEKIEFHHMHNFVIGNDDRDFSRYFVEKYFSHDDRVFINKKLSTVDSIIESMQRSRHNICMRFHSVLFAHTLKVKFTAIDYTVGGKIHAFLKDNNALDYERTIQSFHRDKHNKKI